MPSGWVARRSAPPSSRVLARWWLPGSESSSASPRPLWTSSPGTLDPRVSPSCASSARRLEVTKRMEMDVARDFRSIAQARERVAHHVGIRRCRATGLEGEYEALVFELGLAHLGELALCFAKSGENFSGAGIDAEPADARPGPRALHDRATAHGHDGLVDRDCSVLEVGRRARRDRRRSTSWETLSP